VVKEQLGGCRTNAAAKTAESASLREHLADLKAGLEDSRTVLDDAGRENIQLGKKLETLTSEQRLMKAELQNKKELIVRAEETTKILQGQLDGSSHFAPKYD
jgi:chromosome segregation ATPase